MNGQWSTIGSHEAGVTGVFCLDSGIILSAGLDCYVKFWQNNNCMLSLSLDHKVIAAEFLNGIIVLGLGIDKLAVIDLQSLAKT